MINETEVKAKTDSELLEIWAHQGDYVDEMVTFAKAEIERRNLDTSGTYVPKIEKKRNHAVAVTAAAMLQSPYAKAALGRYENGYTVANAISAVGRVIKNLGISLIAVGLLIAFIGLFQGGLLPIIITGFGVFGAILGLLTYVAGTLVAAQGEMMKAVFDTAVNSSPFLTTDAMATAMGMEAVGD